MARRKESALNFVCVREKEETDDDDVFNEKVHCTCAIATAIGGRLYEDTDPSD